MLTRRELLQTAALATVASTCKSASALAQTRRYGFLATTAIAEAGFIYGLPIVMSYAAMYEHAVDRQSKTFKAPFNRIRNEGRAFTYRDVDVNLPNNDTPYSVAWMDLRAEPIVLSVPEVELEPLLLNHASRWQLLQLWVHWLTCHSKRSRRLHGGRARLERRNPVGYQRCIQVEHSVFNRAVPYAALQSR